MPRLRKKYSYPKSGRRKFLYYYVEFTDHLRRPVRKRVSLGTKDEVVASHKFTDLERKFARGDYDPWTDTLPEKTISLQSAIDKFVTSRRKRNCADSTVQVYQYVLSAFGRTLNPDFPLYGVEERHVEDFLRDRTSEFTKKDYRLRLRIFFSWSVDRSFLRHNPVQRPAATKVARRRDLPEFLTEEQLQHLVATIDSDAIVKGMDNSWLSNAILFTVGTGLRRGELANLRWIDIDPQLRFIHVANREEFTTKSGRERRVPLKGTARDIIDRLSNARRSENNLDFVFTGSNGGPINSQHLSKRFRFYRRLANLPEKIHFHSLRHTFASWAVQRGMDLYILKDLLGHSDIKQTQVYASLKLATLDDAMELAFG